MARLVTGRLKVHAKDDESFGSDEFLNFDLPINKILNGDGQVATIVDGKWRWGGECRLEVRLSAQATSGGVVSVFGDALLFEGTSESTNDLDGRRRVEFRVARTTASNSGPTTYFVKVNNDDEGGDYADINLSLQNFIVEEQ